jgi:hypothetical protein
MKELSYNKASIFRSCPKKFWWRYIEKLDPVTKLPSLSLGSILHEAFDLFYKGSSDQEVYQYISQAFDVEIGKEELSDQEDLLILKYTAQGMWFYYPYKTVKFDHISSEEKFSIPLCRGWKFVGKVDGRVSQFGNWWVRELKTTSLNQRQFEGRCHTSAQGTGYVYGLSTAYDIKGILYEYIKKPILRKGVKENADGFGRRIMQDYKDRPKIYYNHHLSYRNKQDLKNFHFDTCMLARHIEETLETGMFYRNMDSCWTFGSICPYEKICFSEVPDQLTLDLYYTKREEVQDEQGKEG